jgi:hypothetical protein
MSTNPIPAPPGLDPENPTQAQIDSFNAAYLASLPPERLALFAGTFGVLGSVLDPMTRFQDAFALSTIMKVDLLIDGMASNSNPAMVMLNRYRSGYKVFSWIGEPNPDWTTAPPGQSLPGLPPYNATGHTGIVSLLNQAPYVVPPVVKPSPNPALIGPYTGSMASVIGITTPGMGLWEPAFKGLMMPQGYIDPVSGFTFYVLSMSGGLMSNLENPTPVVYWIGPPPAG